MSDITILVPFLNEKIEIYLDEIVKSIKSFNFN